MTMRTACGSATEGHESVCRASVTANDAAFLSKAGTRRGRSAADGRRGAAHEFVRAGWLEREADLIAIDRQEVAVPHLAVAAAAGLDQRLIDRLDAALADRGKLRIMDRLEQRDAAPRDLLESSTVTPLLPISPFPCVVAHDTVPGQKGAFGGSDDGPHP
jgi:hypothetical protein